MKKKEIVKGRLYEWVELQDDIESIKRNIKQYEEDFISLKSPCLEGIMVKGKPRDSKLVDFICKKDCLEEELKAKEKELVELEEKLDLQILDKMEKEIIKAVAKSNYKKAGESLGYSKDRVYRKMAMIYEKLKKSTTHRA